MALGLALPVPAGCSLSALQPAGFKLFKLGLCNLCAPGVSPYGDRFVRDPVVGDDVVIVNQHGQLLRGFVSFMIIGQPGRMKGLMNNTGSHYGGNESVLTVPGEACVSSSIRNEPGEAALGLRASSLCARWLVLGAPGFTSSTVLVRFYRVGVPGPAR